MRSMFMCAALAAVLSFVGCCGTGGKCPLGNCKLGSHLGAGKSQLSRAARNAAPTASEDYAAGGSVGDCGCGGAAATATGCTACGSDSVVSVSAPYACDGGCGCDAAPVVISGGDSSDCGCSSCGGGEVQYAPMQSSGCSACDGAAAAPATKRGLLTQRSNQSDLASNKGIGLFLKGKGKACQDEAGSCSLFSRKKARSLKKSAAGSVASDQGVSCGCDACDAGGAGEEVILPTVAQQPVQYDGGDFYGDDVGGRRISTGIISDVRGARDGRGAHDRRGERVASHGCGVAGCGVDGRACHSCALGGKLRGAAGLARKVTGTAHPYGGAIPHTNPAMGQQPQSGLAPQYAYPYYTTRGPRDFLRDNPPSIGY